MRGHRTQAGVLVVGGELTGLTATLLLRAHGVAATLVEKRSSTSPQPKARRLHMLSMEIFPSAGTGRDGPPGGPRPGRTRPHGGRDDARRCAAVAALAAGRRCRTGGGAEPGAALPALP